MKENERQNQLIEYLLQDGHDRLQQDAFDKAEQRKYVISTRPLNHIFRYQTRMHASRMHTVHCSSCRWGGVCLGAVCLGGVCLAGVCLGGVCLGGVCLGGVCLRGYLPKGLHTSPP